jgi:hypothetical protein
MPDGQYRARFCAKAFGAMEQLESNGDSSDSGEQYLLIFWPDAPRPDQIVKQTSADALYWHQEAAAGPDPAYLALQRCRSVPRAARRRRRLRTT